VVRSCHHGSLVVRTIHVAPIGQIAPQGSGKTAAVSGSLIVVQLALAMLLVITAALFIRTFVRLANVPTGLDRKGVLVATVGVSRIPFSNRLAVAQEALHAARQVPAVAGASFNPPFVGAMVGDLVVSAPGTQAPPDAERVSRLNTITPGWLDAYGITLEGGCDFDDRDALASQRVMIVNDAFVRHFVRNRNPVGTALALTLRYPPYGDTSLGVMTIVGVAENTVYRSLRDASQPQIYVPMAQFGPSTPYTTVFVTVRAVAGSPALLERGVASAISMRKWRPEQHGWSLVAGERLREHNERAAPDPGPTLGQAGSICRF
jgi:putative ABC transport system permease protein